MIRVMATARWSILLLGILLLVTVAAPAPVRAEEQPGASALFNNAEGLYRSGDYDEALGRFRAFVLRYYSSPRIDDAYLYIARIFQKKQQCSEALLYLDRIPAERRLPEARLLDGVCQLEQGRADAGLAELRTLFDVTLTDEDQALFYGALFRGEVAQERLLPGIAFAWRALATPGDHRALLADVHLLLESRLGEEELGEVWFMFRGSAVGQDAGLQLARRALARKKDALARSWLDQVLSDPTPFPYRTDATALQARLQGGDALVQRDAVGVLLPLTGRYATFGALVQRGMDLALKLHNQTHSPVRFLYRDTAADPDIAVRQFTGLVNEDRVMALAGPLTGAVAETIAIRAGQERVPVLTLSQKDGLPQRNGFTFRDSLTAELQARSLARHAVRDRGLRSFGVLYPDNRFGHEFAYLFAREVLREGGLVVAAESYKEKDTDFRGPVRHLIGKDPDEQQEKPPRLSEQEELEDLFVPEALEFPAVPFDALFIPDYADKIGLITPQLAFYGLEDTPLLGINGWNSPDLVKLAGKHVEGATFVDGFFRHSQLPFVKEFIDLYFDTYKEEPSILEAQAFDVANILLYLMDRPDIRNREDLRNALALLRDYPGVTGATSFGADGDADKILFLLQVKKGVITQIN